MHLTGREEAAMIIIRKPIASHCCTRTQCRVPPSPELLAKLIERYNELMEQERVPKDLTFKQFFDVWASRRRGSRCSRTGRSRCSTRRRRHRPMGSSRAR